MLETRKQLIADIAEGYDLVILGADKWAQLHDLSFYKDKEHMAQCLRRLPKLAVAPRNGIAVPQEILLTVLKKSTLYLRLRLDVGNLSG